jgi:hypothetical protein
MGPQMREVVRESALDKVELKEQFGEHLEQ